MDAIDKQIKKDCRKAMFSPWLIGALKEIISGVLLVYMATLTADFADAILEMNSDYVYSNFYLIVGYVVISAAGLPLLDYLCNVILIKHALLHDKKVISRFLDKKYNKAMEMNVGEVQYRLENDPNDYRLIWMELMTNYIYIPVTAVYILYASLKLSPIYAIVTIALSAVKLIVPTAIVKINAKYDEIAREYETGIRDCEADIIKRPYYAVIFDIREGLMKRLDKRFWRYYHDVFKKQNIFRSVTSFLSECVDTLSYLAVVLVGAYFVSGRILSVGSIAAMLGYFSIYNNLFASLAATFRKRAVLNNVKVRLRALYQDAETEGGYIIDNIKTISGENVSYRYEEKSAISNLSFSVSALEHAALCGANGSGKSTFMKILCGLNEDYQGRIKVNGIELSSLNITEWRKKVAFALQNPYLFQGTVLDNLTIGDLASEEDAIKMLRELNSDNLIDRDAANLSGGERQKISIAMALLKNTPLLLLDEPDNNLDEEGLTWLNDIIKNSDKTILFISHRKEIAELASQILWF